ncbi:MAG: hypothetical protein HY584_03575 [Candidatus Omnitrophica bacterium]|nr:hypothetical protein [Candidatus Omnitrophota bacterium]
MKRNRIFCLASIWVLLMGGWGYAQTSSEEISETSPECGVCEVAESQDYGESAPGKIGRGLVNIGLGWTNLIAQPIQAGSSGGNVGAGFGKGLWLTLVRTVQGVAEIGLFWLPPGPEEALKHCALGDLGVTGR